MKVQIINLASVRTPSPTSRGAFHAARINFRLFWERRFLYPSAFFLGLKWTSIGLYRKAKGR
jgi:hypothetical protein